MAEEGQVKMFPKDTAIAELYKAHPSLWEDFRKMVELVDQIKKDSWAYARLASCLLDLICSLQKHSDDRDLQVGLGRFAVATEFVETCVEFHRQIMREKNLEYLTEFDFDDSDCEMQCLYLAEGIFLNLSCFGMEFRLCLARTGILRQFLENLKHIQHLSAECLESSSVFVHSIGTIQNCSRHPDVLPTLREMDVVQHVTPFAKKSSPKIKGIAQLTLSILVDENDLELIKLDKDVLHYFLDCGIQSLAASGHDFSCWSLEAIVLGLSRFARNAFNRRSMVAEGYMKLLMGVLEAGRKEEKEWATFAVLELSKDPENVRIFQNDGQLMKALTQLKTCDNVIVRDTIGQILIMLHKPEADDDDRKRLNEFFLHSSNAMKILGCTKVEFLLNQIQISSIAGHHDTKEITIAKLLKGLNDLSKNDDIKSQIVSQGGLDILASRLHSGDDEEKLETSNLLASLATSANHRSFIKGHSGLSHTLKELQHADNTTLSQTEQTILRTLNRVAQS